MGAKDAHRQHRNLRFGDEPHTSLRRLLSPWCCGYLRGKMSTFAIAKRADGLLQRAASSTINPGWPPPATRNQQSDDQATSVQKCEWPPQAWPTKGGSREADMVAKPHETRPAATFKEKRSAPMTRKLHSRATSPGKRDVTCNNNVHSESGRRPASPRKTNRLLMCPHDAVKKRQGSVA